MNSVPKQRSGQFGTEDDATVPPCRQRPLNPRSESDVRSEGHAQVVIRAVIPVDFVPDLQA